MLREKNGKRRMFSLVTDLDALRGKIDEIGSVVLIIIDPLSAYIGTGKVNSHMTADVRGFLAPLVDLAAEKKVAVIGIMHFNKKSDVTNAMLRIADSLAYVAAARHVYFVADDAEVESRRLFVKAKNNLSPDNKALSYFISAKMVGTDEQTGKEIWALQVDAAAHLETRRNWDESALTLRATIGHTQGLSALYLFARQHGPSREQPLMARARALVVIQEFERAFSQLQHCHVGRRTHIEGSPIIERREHARSIDGRACDDLA